METKICTKCGRELPLDNFHKYNRRNQTHHSSCKDCQKAYKQENKDKLLIAQYARRKNPNQTEKLKISAWNKLNYALRVGKIIKPEKCSICGCYKEKIQAHHRDYSEPLEVVWCCQTCHSELDKVRRSNNDTI